MVSIMACEFTFVVFCMVFVCGILTEDFSPDVRYDTPDPLLPNNAEPRFLDSEDEAMCKHTLNRPDLTLGDMDEKTQQQQDDEKDDEEDDEKLEDEDDETGECLFTEEMDYLSSNANKDNPVQDTESQAPEEPEDVLTSEEDDLVLEEDVWWMEEGFLADEEGRRQGGVAAGQVHVVLACCGEASEEALVHIKSALLLTQAVLHYHIFTEDHLKPRLLAQFEAWRRGQVALSDRLRYTLYPTWFPDAPPLSSLPAQDWSTLFSACSAQRLFVPGRLQHLQRVMFVDIDTVFLQPPEHLWRYFDDFNSSHVAALVAEHEREDISWYSRVSDIPHYPSVGLNAGLILMDIRRILDLDWQDKMISYFDTYGQHPSHHMVWKDQDAINIFFHFHPEALLLLPCSWNYRQDHCQYMKSCPPAETEGAALVHGNRKVFHNDKEVTFRAVFEAFRDHDLSDPRRDLLQRLRRNLDNEIHSHMPSRLPHSSKVEPRTRPKFTYCVNLLDVFLKPVEQWASLEEQPQAG